MRSVALVVHEEKPEAVAVADRVVAAFTSHNVSAIPIKSDAVPDDVEALIGVGGDGTVLQAGHLALPRGLPVAGVNVGRVGYLAEFAVTEIESLAAAVAADHLHAVERMTAAVHLEDRSEVAINEVVIEKSVSQRIVEIEVAIDGHRFARYRTDGIIVSTPVGSTAYSLSAGGPVVDPRLETLVLTPVAPHSLFSRSLVLSPDATIEVTVATDRAARVNVDGGEVATIEPGKAVTVRRGPAPIRFLTLGGHPFPQAVRHQFGLDHA